MPPKTVKRVTKKTTISLRGTVTKTITTVTTSSKVAPKKITTAPKKTIAAPKKTQAKRLEKAPQKAKAATKPKAAARPKADQWKKSSVEMGAQQHYFFNIQRSGQQNFGRQNWPD